MRIPTESDFRNARRDRDVVRCAQRSPKTAARHPAKVLRHLHPVALEDDRRSFRRRRSPRLCHRCSCCDTPAARRCKTGHRFTFDRRNTELDHICGSSGAIRRPPAHRRRHREDGDSGDDSFAKNPPAERDLVRVRQGWSVKRVCERRRRGAEKSEALKAIRTDVSNVQILEGDIARRGWRRRTLYPTYHRPAVSRRTHVPSLRRLPSRAFRARHARRRRRAAAYGAALRTTTPHVRRPALPLSALLLKRMRTRGGVTPPRV